MDLQNAAKWAGAALGGGAVGAVALNAVPGVDGRAVAEMLGAALGAGVVAALAAQRTWRTRMRELVAGVLAEERAAQVDALRAELRTVVRDELRDMVRAALHDELAEPLRRLAHLEGQMQVVRGQLGPVRTAVQGEAKDNAA